MEANKSSESEVIDSLVAEASLHGLTREDLFQALTVIDSGTISNLYHLSLYRSHCLQNGVIQGRRKFNRETQ